MCPTRLWHKIVLHASCALWRQLDMATVSEIQKVMAGVPACFKLLIILDIEGDLVRALFACALFYLVDVNVSTKRIIRCTTFLAQSSLLIWIQCQLDYTCFYPRFGMDFDAASSAMTDLLYIFKVDQARYGYSSNLGCCKTRWTRRRITCSQDTGKGGCTWYLS